MKSDAAHLVPLADDVVAILESLPRFKRGDYLFSTTFGARPVRGFNKPKVRLDRAMRAEIGEMEPWTTHDIRRTMRTGLSALPVAPTVAELVIAHAQRGMHKVYDQHSYADEKRRALELWAERLREIVKISDDTDVSRQHDLSPRKINEEARVDGAWKRSGVEEGF
jgi:integrase